MGDTTFDIGPGETNRMAPARCHGIGLGVAVGRGVDVRVASGVSDGGAVPVRAAAVSVPAAFTAEAVSAMTVGKYSGGYGVGTFWFEGAQAERSPRMETNVRRY